MTALLLVRLLLLSIVLYFGSKLVYKLWKSSSVRQKIEDNEIAAEQCCDIKEHKKKHNNIKQAKDIIDGFTKED